MIGVSVGVAIGSSVIGRIADGKPLRVHLACLDDKKLMRLRQDLALAWLGLGAVIQ